MKKILILTKDTLFWTKINRRLSQGGAGVVRVSAPAKVGSYLGSGEFAVLIVDEDGTCHDMRRWMRQWITCARLKCVLSTAKIQDSIRNIIETARVEFRSIEKDHLMVLAHDIVMECCPVVFQASYGSNGTDLSDRRDLPRVEKSLRVFLEYPGMRSVDGMKSRTVDISPYGARIITDEHIKPDSKISMRILLPFFSKMITLKARVIWSTGFKDQHSFTSGIFFDWFRDSDRFKLARYLVGEHPLNP